ncbi:MAG: hypothetical protein HKO94_11430 [Flavobacteriaceae bacterium]|nr:hypothetical protein [Flavobacteriaceae bacterium]
MIDFLKRTAILIFVTLILASVFSMGSLWKLRNSSFYKPSFLVNDVEEQSFDYIVLGASTGLTTLNTKYIDSTMQMTGINLSMDDTGMPSHFLMLQHFLAQGKSTKYCILAPGLSSYNSTDEKLSDNDYRFLMFNNSAYVQDYFKSFKGTEARVLTASRYLPLIGVSYYNAELFYPSLMNIIRPEKRNRFDERGNYTYPVIRHTDEGRQDPREINVTFRSQYLAKIKALCEENGIRLICYISPMKDRTAKVQSLEYEYINHSRKIKGNKFFYDRDHVNTLGRKLASAAFSEALGNYIEQHLSPNLN